MVESIFNGIRLDIEVYNLKILTRFDLVRFVCLEFIVMRDETTPI